MLMVLIAVDPTFIVYSSSCTRVMRKEISPSLWEIKNFSAGHFLILTISWHPPPEVRHGKVWGKVIEWWLIAQKLKKISAWAENCRMKLRSMKWASTINNRVPYMTRGGRKLNRICPRTSYPWISRLIQCLYLLLSKKVWVSMTVKLNIFAGFCITHCATFSEIAKRYQFVYTLERCKGLSLHSRFLRSRIELILTPRGVAFVWWLSTSISIATIDLRSVIIQ